MKTKKISPSLHRNWLKFFSKISLYRHQRAVLWSAAISLSPREQPIDQERLQTKPTNTKDHNEDSASHERNIFHEVIQLILHFYRVAVRPKTMKNTGGAKGK